MAVASAIALAGCSGGRPATRSAAPPPTAPAPPAAPAPLEGTASFYGQWHHGRLTASGDVFDMNKLTAAHRTLPFGTRVRVTNLDNGRQVDVRINDRGPYSKRRILDLSRAAAKELRMIEAGVARVRIELLD